MTGLKVFPEATTTLGGRTDGDTLDASHALHFFYEVHHGADEHQKSAMQTNDAQATEDVSIKIPTKQQTWQNELLSIASSEDDDRAKEKAGQSVFDLLAIDHSLELPSWKKRLIDGLDSLATTIVMTLLTILVLFLDDVRIAALPPEADDPIVVFTYIAFFCFSVELVLNSISRPKFFMSFYFWLDFVSTISLLGDIPEFMDLFDGSTDSGGGGGEQTAIARAGKTSRAGSRAGRIARVMRLVRLIRLVKLYKQYESTKDKQNEPEEIAKQSPSEMAESRVGQRLSDLTTRRVIIGVLGMLFILPLFEVESGYYGQLSPFDTHGLEMLHEAAQATNPLSGAVNRSLKVFVDNVHYSLGSEYTSKIIELTIWNVTRIPFERVRLHRPAEVSSSDFFTDACDDQDWDACFHTTALFDIKWAYQLNAILNIVKTIFIILVLALGAIFFSRDADILVLKPLERMIQTVRDISENPLAKIADDEDGDKEDVEMETRVLETSLKKICSLLAVGFGDAGAQIIAENMRKAGALDPMVPGRKIRAIFGFCDIRQFTDTTEVLEEEIMEFVNAIAHIVHSEVAYHGGAANKNIGDAFLLVWKLPGSSRGRDGKRQSLIDPNMADFKLGTSICKPSREGSMVTTGGETRSSGGSTRLGVQPSSLSLLDPRQDKIAAIQKVADDALAAFVIIHAAIKRSTHIKSYTVREDLNKRMPGFLVRMGFGMHVGWAIEGAIGSGYKIDASYLSPNVNMAARLEAATKQFRTSILLSSDFVSYLSPPVFHQFLGFKPVDSAFQVRNRVRQIDRVTVKGSQKPMGLFTYDIDLEAIAEAVLPKHASEYTSTSYSVENYDQEWKEHPDLVHTWAVDEAFLETFAVGFEHYQEGEWKEAQDVLEGCRWARRDRNGDSVEDGPSVTLLQYMEQFDNQAPEDWPGYRELVEK